MSPEAFFFAARFQGEAQNTPGYAPPSIMRFCPVIKPRLRCAGGAEAFEIGEP
jgi:hypothetical protein